MCTPGSLNGDIQTACVFFKCEPRKTEIRIRFCCNAAAGSSLAIFSSTHSKQNLRTCEFAERAVTELAYPLAK